MGILDKYTETFDMGGDYRHVYASHDMLAEVQENIFLYRKGATLKTHFLSKIISVATAKSI